MYVEDLQPGMLIELEMGLRYYFQESSKSSLPRLRTAPEVIAAVVAGINIDIKQDPVMYLGETNEHFKKTRSSRSKLRTIIVDGKVAYVEGREFKNFNPIF